MSVLISSRSQRLRSAAIATPVASSRTKTLSIAISIALLGVVSANVGAQSAASVVVATDAAPSAPAIPTIPPAGATAQIVAPTTQPPAAVSPLGLPAVAPTPLGVTTQKLAIEEPARVVQPSVAPTATSVSSETLLIAPNDVAPIIVNELPATPQNAAAAPIIVPPPSDLWDRIRSGYAMQDLDDPLVGKWEKFYATRPDYMARIVDRSGKYMFYIVTELERRGMPLEIALLPMIESAFNPIAHSSAKASGIWQFIPSTGTAFGMKQDWWADSRRDIVAATNGALDYLTKLHGMFGDWQLALASYNWGEGAVGRASARAKAAGRDGTYLTLNMPDETRNYLPKLQAVKNIIRNPAAFGLTIASIPNEPYFKTITLSHAIDLKKAAQLAGMTEPDFIALNPAHNRPVIAGRGDFQILLPADKADVFLSRLEADERPKVSWMAYKTRAGDRIDTLASRFGTTIDALKSVNGIRSPAAVLPAGYHLLVPSDGPSADALGSIQNAVFTKFPEYVAPRAHRVRKGETFAGIAKRYGIAPATLAKWNRVGKQSARAGQLLYISGPAPTRAAKGGRYVKAKRGNNSVRKAGGKAVKRAPVKKKSR
ncbi:MAG: LysM peptidoglycan-binding domain-containing protein [Betaproteobacteria bacterium]|nr:MAG: LysM peptidoglycan-binding domain-containing protein [Betaproteobacteria bacterium]